MTRRFVCTHCGNAWEAESKPGRPPGYCSDPCRKAAAVKRTADWQIANPDRNKVNKQKTWAQYYTKNRARQIARAVEYARTHPEWKRARDSARHAKTRGAPTAERFTLDEIFTRDRKRCHLCGKRVTRKEATVDHLIPVALGGEHTRANVSLAHRSCNSSKKTKAMGEQLALI